MPDFNDTDLTEDQIREQNFSNRDPEDVRDDIEYSDGGFNDFDFEDDNVDDFNEFSFSDADEFKDPREEDYSDDEDDQDDEDEDFDDLDDEDDDEEEEDQEAEDEDFDLDDDELDDEDDNHLSPQSMSDDDLVKILKEKGYSISEPEDKSAIRVNQINVLNSQVDSLKSILSGSEDDILKEGIKLQLQQQYKSQGKNINSEDFEDDLADQLTGLDLNPVLRSTVLNGFKRDLAFVIQQKESQRDSIQQEHKAELDTEVRRVREETKKSVSNLSKEYGLNLSQAKEVWNFIKSGELSKITNNPDFVARAVIAELASRKGQKLFSKDEGYARGVADTLAEFKKNKDASKVQRSLLGKQMSGRESGLSAKTTINPWLSNLYVDEEEYSKAKPKKKNQRAAGKI